MRDRYDFSDSKPNPYAKRMEQQITLPSDLWCESASRRLRAAKSLTAPQLDYIHKALCEGCPVEPWPYGNATSINPLLVTLGVSPGDSPQAGDLDTAPLKLPPAGSPHPHVKNYQDGKRYWDKVRHLARAVITPPDGSETDAYALFGNMNLDPKRSGDASRVAINPTFAEWVLRTIKCQLRPRWLVCLGLKGKLEQEPLRQIFESIFELNLGKPDEQHQLLASNKKYFFREWQVDAGSDPLTVVLWPNHPSRPPFGDFELWRGACEQFRVRHAERLSREI